MEYNNDIGGRYFGQLTKKILTHHEENNPWNLFEYHIPIYGRNKNEWDILAQWLLEYDLKSDLVCYTIDIPQKYDQLSQLGDCNTFQDYLDSTFSFRFILT